MIFPVATTDFTPFAQAVTEKKPDVVVGHYGSGQNLSVIPALRRLGYNGPYVVASYGVTEDTVRQAAERAGSGENIYYVTRYSRRSTTILRSAKLWPRRRSTARRSRSPACTSPVGRSAYSPRLRSRAAVGRARARSSTRPFSRLKVDMGGLRAGRSRCQRPTITARPIGACTPGTRRLTHSSRKAMG